MHWLEHDSIDTVLIGLTDGELAWDEATGDLAAAWPVCHCARHLVAQQMNLRHSEATVLWLFSKSRTK